MLEKGGNMDTQDLLKAKTIFENEGVRFVKELESHEIGGIITSYSGPGGFNWIAVSTNMKNFDPDESELIHEILSNVAEGRI
jgi:hypothetical protein